MRPDARMQRHDILLAVVLCVGTLISAGLSSVAGLYGTSQSGMPLAVAYAFVVSAPLAVRRRWPASVAVVVCTAYFLAVTLHVPELYAGSIAMFIAIHTVGAWSADRRRALWVRAAIIAGMFVWLLVVMFVEATRPAGAEGLSRAGAFSPFVAMALLNLLVNALYFGGAYWFGERSYAATVQRRQLEERTAELERERERTAAQAVALDRVRIARELHDVVAHHVSLMGVQAGAARTVMTADPAAAAATLTQVEASARSALGELRHLLETLRAAPADDVTAAVGLAGLAGLVDEAVTAGVPAALTVVGEAHPVPETVQVSLYRIAQEALTNTRRHAGPGAAADVRLRYTAGAVELEISDTGRTPAVVAPGLGLVGMRERAAACGGTLEARPGRDGGFLVRARIPLAEVPDA